MNADSAIAAVVGAAVPRTPAAEVAAALLVGLPLMLCCCVLAESAYVQTGAWLDNLAGLLLQLEPASAAGGLAAAVAAQQACWPCLAAGLAEGE